ncbi:hypothetical protein PIB30_035490 [Stylosanthes scabra]|uniref:Uncharacterized protein n=1 Tax=Stylosanthes scabra TaxID=79078 RepID=A0ABU6XEP8_9FABA|nr:hypothetical protein [Stylosanthes scabra]
MALARAYERGDDMNMAEIYYVIGQEETNWADNLANNTIPKSINNAIINPRATAWHKIINANIDPKTRGTNFGMKYALLIYVLMTEGQVNLPRIMWDILVLRPTKHPCNLLPYPVFISRIAARHEVRRRGKPPPQDQPAEQLPQPEKFAAPTVSAQYLLEPTM